MLTKREAAERLRISKVTLDHHIRNGLVTSIKLGKFIFFREKDLDRFVRSCERKASRRKNVVDA